MKFSKRTQLSSLFESSAAQLQELLFGPVLEFNSKEPQAELSEFLILKFQGDQDLQGTFRDFDRDFRSCRDPLTNSIQQNRLPHFSRLTRLLLNRAKRFSLVYVDLTETKLHHRHRVIVVLQNLQ